MSVSTRLRSLRGVASELGVPAAGAAIAAGVALFLAPAAPAAAWVVLALAATGSLALAGPGLAPPRRRADQHSDAGPAPTIASAVRTLTHAVLLVPLAALTVEQGALWRAGLTGLALSLALAPAVQALGGRAAPFSRGVPGADVTPARVTPPVVLDVHAAALLGLVGAGAAATAFEPDGAAAAAGTLISLCALAVTAASLASSAGRIRRRRAFDVRAYVSQLAPTLLVHWEGPAGTGYQLGMWLPHLERSGLRLLVVVRRPQNLRDVPATSAPVLVLPSLADLDQVLVPSVRAAVYVNGATANAHLVRHTGLTHIQLNHGDSDKPPSYNPAFRMYDKNFVAGQAAVDRFAAHGIATAPGFFEIVGRPQVTGIVPRAMPAAPGRLAAPVVLYAPTWSGDRTDVRLTSLPSAVDVVTALLAQGATVLFRPHPHALSSPLAQHVRAVDALLAAHAREHGRAHQPSQQALAAPLATLVNDSDALVADVSSVVSDYLFARKPYVILAMDDAGEAEFRTANPVTRGGHVVHRAGIVTTLGHALTEALTEDPFRAARDEVRRHHLGDIPDDGYAERFREVLRAVVLGPSD